MSVYKKLINNALVILLVTGALFLLIGNRVSAEESTFSSTFSVMDTEINVSYVTTTDKNNLISDELNILANKYHLISNNFFPLSEEEQLLYYNNIYMINSQVDEEVKISFELYELLQLSNNVNAMTNGYFNIGIGKQVDIYKQLISFESGNWRQDISEVDYNNAISSVELIKTGVSDVILTAGEIDGVQHYSARITGNTKLDLGAISKGYLVEQMKQVLLFYDVTVYLINGGSSSIAIGTNSGSTDGCFNVGLSNPAMYNKYRSQFSTIFKYGSIRLKDLSISTSNYGEQFSYYNKNTICHIVSPIENKPVNYNQTVTLIGDDAGLLDALSTACYSMPYEDIVTLLDNIKHTTGKTIMAIVMLDSMEIKTILNEYSFVINPDYAQLVSKPGGCNKGCSKKGIGTLIIWLIPSLFSVSFFVSKPKRY